MKLTILIVLLISFSNTYSQKIEKRIGDYKVLIEGYFYGENNKKKKTSKAEFYFDDSGKILEKISYGKHHYAKLNVIGEIEQFFYKDELLQMSKSYTSYCNSCDYYQLYTVYKYDGSKISNESTYYTKNDSLFNLTTYTYKPGIIETTVGQSTSYQKIYDTNNKIKELNQIYSNKLRWQYKYEYSENCRIGDFQTYYGDGKENSKKEIECFDTQNRIISKEIIDSYKTKTLYFYSKDGILTRIDEYENLNEEEGYKLSRQYRFKMKHNANKLDAEIVKRINNELTPNETSI